jgi:hypothetical protein
LGVEFVDDWNEEAKQEMIENLREGAVYDEAENVMHVPAFAGTLGMTHIKLPDTR